MKIKITQRGRFVVYSLLVIGIFAAVGFAIFIVAQLGSASYIQNNAPICISDTVKQPDGSCISMEN